MAIFLNRPIHTLLGRARHLFGMSQADFGKLLGVSRRTAARYEYGHSEPLIAQVMELARMAHARGDVALARELAGSTSETLESLGIVPAVKPPEPFTPPPRLVVDAVVCAAADALEESPGTMRGTRAAVLAAFRRARELRLNVEEVEKALAPTEVEKTARTPRTAR
ncbi:MAG TPA: helix-turn-helix transcriptional regulator [Polyangiaceae bacterium]|jgi:transcriptional regulator with XRE-family HTH domain